MLDENNTVVLTNVTSYLSSAKYGAVLYINLNSRLIIYDITA